MPIDATRLAPKLYIGSAPPTGKALRDAGFDVLVLCAEEYQPTSQNFPGVHVIHAPIDDTDKPPREDVLIVSEASKLVADAVRSGKRTLVTCMAGRNRSGFVSAAALHRLTGRSGAECAEYVRVRRVDPSGQHALANPAFVNLLQQL